MEALIGLGIIAAAAIRQQGRPAAAYPSFEENDDGLSGAGRTTGRLAQLTRVNGELRAAPTNVMNDPYIMRVDKPDPALERATAQIHGGDPPSQRSRYVF